MENNVDELTFREAMGQLEQIVGQLESGELELEESLERYALGVALLSSLQRRLKGAEQKVEVLMGELAESVDDDTQDTTLQKA
ncbi:MAG: exodeoxyribonuclease VII small subunit [Eggerthellaceae bacterium]|nr:exodeoxyribonuclease VII small subunit [Eggerthellaceae bacterium]